MNMIVKMVVATGLFLLLFLSITSVHELGHYLMLQIFHVPVKEFSIGIGPVLRQYKRNNIWSLRLLLVMAYVDFEMKDDAYQQLPVWKKLAVLSMGAIDNFILALICLFPTWSNPLAFDPLIRAFDTHLGIGPISLFIIIARLGNHFLAFVLFLGIFSLLASIMNLLPIPGFDGGWILTTILHIPEGKCEPIAMGAIRIIKIISIFICVADIIILIIR